MPKGFSDVSFGLSVVPTRPQKYVIPDSVSFDLFVSFSKFWIYSAKSQF